MSFGFGGNGLNHSIKRRLEDDDDDQCTVKQQQLQSPSNTGHLKQQQLPSITYASPDYRPAVRSDALWLQPPPPLSTMAMDENMTDEDDSTTVPTPSSSSSSQQQQLNNKPISSMFTATAGSSLEHHSHV